MADAAKPIEPGQTQQDNARVSVSPSMTEGEIRDAGLAIDVPFESGQPEPERLRYGKLGMTWTPPEGWPPVTGQPQDEDDPNA